MKMSKATDMTVRCEAPRFVQIQQTVLRRGRSGTILVALLFLLLPLAAVTTVAQGDPSHIQMDSSRADQLDLNNDGDPDTIRIVYLLNTSSHYAEAAVQVDVESGGMPLTFWENVTFNRSTPYFGSQDIEAWGDGVYSVRLKVWDAESGILILTEDLGEYELKAKLVPPFLKFESPSTQPIMIGDDCSIERIFSDDIGERYDTMGTISLTGTPWLVADDLSVIDCSTWPAGDYDLGMFYRNGLGFIGEADFQFTIHTLPPPGFKLNVTGQHGEVGSVCAVAIEPSLGTTMALMTIEWDITDPRGDEIESAGFSSIDCRLWQVGLTKVRVTVTSGEGQETIGAVNLVRLPPTGSASEEVLNASGPESLWPDRSLGAGHEATPFFGNSNGVAQGVVFLIGALIAILLGIFAAVMWTRRGEEDGYMTGIVGDAIEPDSDGLPSYVDPTGVYWRQHADGNVDWYDAVVDQWVPYEET